MILDSDKAMSGLHPPEWQVSNMDFHLPKANVSGLTAEA